MIYIGFVWFCIFFPPCLEVSEQVFGLLWLPPDSKGAGGSSASLLWPPVQGDAKECIAEVPPLAAQGKVVS